MKKWMALAMAAVLALTSLVGCGTSSNGGDEGTWPKKDINIVITMSAGGDGDYLTRLLAPYLEEELGVQLVITNLAGGNGSVGMDELMNTDADGYTFYVNNTCALSANEANGLVDYDYTVSDPVAITAKHSGEMVWVRADSPYQTMDDLVKATQANPGEVTIGVSMGGSVYAAAMMLKKAGAEFSLVDASDGADRIIALLGGQVDCCIAGYGIGKEYIESGDLRPLCTLMGSRSAALPDVPTAEEAGVEGLVINNMFLFLAPKGTDPAVVEAMNAAIMKITTENEEYAAAVTAYSGQPAYAESVKDTIATLDKTRDQFMAISELLK